MTLTLEQVRQTRFHLARRNGYEPVDVDNFVDKVEATLSQLTEENGSLKKQLEALSSSEPSSIFVPGDNADADKLRAELAELASGSSSWSAASWPRLSWRPRSPRLLRRRRTPSSPRRRRV